MTGIIVLEENELRLISRALNALLSTYNHEDMDYMETKRLKKEIDKIIRNNLQKHKGGKEL